MGIANNDADENPFTFNVTGVALTSQALFNEVAAEAELVGLDAEPEATPFHDGVENLLKYAFNMNLAGPDTVALVTGTGTSGLPSISPSANGMIRIDFIRRRSAGLIYTLKRSSTLAPGSFETLTTIPVVTRINATWDRVVIEETTSLPATFFIVEVALP